MIYREAKKGDVVLRVYVDDFPEDPRSWDNLGTMVCWHKRYRLGDKHNFSTVRDFLESLVYDLMEDERFILNCLNDGESVDHIIEEMSDEELWEIINKHAVVLPLYLYDHGGLCMNTTGFACPWDSGQVGWIYVTHKRIKEEFIGAELDEISEATRKKSEEILKEEVRVYSDYINGSVYGFRLVKVAKCEKCGGESEEEIDSCWGFYGDDFQINGLCDHIPEEYVCLVDEL
ncbi:MAG: hypothetical protein AB1330_01900 [Bacillota bacterium]